MTTVNAREVYRELRNYLAGQYRGSTRDEVLLHEALKAVLSKGYIDSGRMSSGALTPAAYHAAWAQVQADLPAVFPVGDGLGLSDSNLTAVSRIISAIDLHDTAQDPFGDLYEVFLGEVAKGKSGQFFTPNNAVRLLSEMVAVQPGESVIDPACGAGSFLAESIRRQIAQGVDPREAANAVWGVDKDDYLARLAMARLALLTSFPSKVAQADSLAWEGEGLPKWGQQFDVVLTNPPFGSKIVAVSKAKQAGFSLGHRWKRTREGLFQITDSLAANPAPQVLFVERCLELLRPGGRLGIVLPESLVSSKTHRFVVAYLTERADVNAVIGMPESLFKVSGSGGTHTKTCLVVATKHVDVPEPPAKKSRIFMAEVQYCGNDSRGRTVFPDELPEVSARWTKTLAGKKAPVDHLSYMVDASEVADGVLAPRYYNPDVTRQLSALRLTHDLVKVQDLIDSGVLEVKTGDEVGKQAYGAGDIPFVRTSDLSNWEIKSDAKHCVSEDVYKALAARQDIREGDLLMVRDGTYLIGTCAYVTKYDTRVVYQSHILKLRVKDDNRISPFLLLALLSSAPVQAQIKAKRFTQDIIDSLGDRLGEVVLPIPKDAHLVNHVVSAVRQSINDRVEARELARSARSVVIEGLPH